jgi:TonB family protein
LAWAVAASVAVHAAILISTFSGGGRGTPQPQPTTLEATLVGTTQVAAEIPEAMEQATPVLTAMAPMPSALAMPALPATRTRTTTSAHPAPRAGIGTLEVAAELLADRTRLGEYYDRQSAEFPIEVDRPPRIDGKIVARYPAGAARDAREDFVVVWAIVDASGTVQEAHAVQGSDEFAAEALAAVRAARFMPAENKRRVQPYPIALQFDFRAGGTAAALAK